MVHTTEQLLSGRSQMHIMEVAIEMEREGASFYDTLAADSQDEGLKKIFSLLADDERRHERIFRAMSDGVGGDEVPLKEHQSDELLSALDGQKFAETQKQMELYERALEIELKSIEFYTEAMDSLTDPADIRIVKQVIQEERKHYDTLDTIVQMVSRPDSWVEDAEFGVRDEY